MLFNDCVHHYNQKMGMEQARAFKVKSSFSWFHLSAPGKESACHIGADVSSIRLDRFMFSTVLIVIKHARVQLFVGWIGQAFRDLPAPQD